MFVSLVLSTSKHMFGWCDFWDKSPKWFLKILKFPRFTRTISKIFRNALRQFMPNHPHRHMITSTKPFRSLVKGKEFSGRQFPSLAVQATKLLTQTPLLHLGIVTENPCILLLLPVDLPRK